MRLTEEQKAKALMSLKEHGTMVEAAKEVGCSTYNIREEMKRSLVFKSRVEEAREQGKSSVGDKALTVIEIIAFGENSSEKGKLTAAAMLANAFIPGFRGVSHTESKIQHNINVVTSVPRPEYKEVITVEPKLLPSAEERLEAQRIYQRNYKRKKKVEKMGKGLVAEVESNSANSD